VVVHLEAGVDDDHVAVLGQGAERLPTNARFAGVSGKQLLK